MSIETHFYSTQNCNRQFLQLIINEKKSIQNRGGVELVLGVNICNEVTKIFHAVQLP